LPITDDVRGARTWTVGAPKSPHGVVSRSPKRA
jgi:hypothetical protein